MERANPKELVVLDLEMVDLWVVLVLAAVGCQCGNDVMVLEKAENAEILLKSLPPSLCHVVQEYHCQCHLRIPNLLNQQHPLKILEIGFELEKMFKICVKQKSSTVS